MKTFILTIIFSLLIVNYAEASWGPNMFNDAYLGIVMTSDGQGNYIPSGSYILNLQGDNNNLHTDVRQVIGVPQSASTLSLFDSIQLGEYQLSITPPEGINISNINCISDDSLNTFAYYTNGVTISINKARSTTNCTFQTTVGPTKAPVLIVPGVLGTELKQNNLLLWANIKKMLLDVGDQFMDPLQFSVSLFSSNDIVVGAVLRTEPTLDYTQGLINEFTSQGYTEGKDLFTFPYDWRYGASGLDESGKEVNIEALKGQIDYVLNQTDAGKAADKVDIVAHSTGGLIVKKYIQEHSTDHHINKAVFVGVPNWGAPKAYKTLLIGDNFGVLGLSSDEMKKLAQNMPVVYDLTPSLNYFNQIGSVLHRSSGFTSKDLSFGEVADELQKNNWINTKALVNSQTLHDSIDDFDLRTAGIDQYNLIGCKTSTFGEFTETISSTNSVVFDFPKTTTGDGTVPLASAQSLPVDLNHIFFAPKIKHSDLLSSDGARQEIVNIISGANLDTKGKILSNSEVVNNPKLCQIKGEVIKIKSPVSIDVVDQDGNHSGLIEDGSIENSIPGADYEIWGEHKYVFLPTDDNQQYSIDLQGTGNGTFTLQDETIQADEPTQTQSFIDVPVTTLLKGNVKLSQTGITLNLDNNGDGLIDQTLQPDTAVSGDYSEDVTPPSITIYNPLTNANYLHSDVIGIHIDVTDNTGIFSTTLKIDGQNIPNNSNLDLFNLALGTHNFTADAVDLLGNKSSTSTPFTVIATKASTISDIQRCLMFGWIDNQGIGNSLTKKVQNQDRYKSFLNELNAQNGKHVNLQAFNVLTNDINWMLAH